ncbi:putative TFIIH and nucleotide excision repair factor 3 complexes subunit [Trichodelitschia bisporula]|uniref:RNA polymerase II transcription factor B subunit 2 n=1 Tax=Trichodelitschia bisporula TaxID=703511 RepID=A0A6G1I515_9PEZI|nr:putative TFIIH and nucleotide excision repair factor 3 complexes subunit [Trichodelitschia bisporula]
MSSTLFDYLQQQPGMAYTRLYRQPSAVLAVLRRMLPHLAKTIVMALLYMPQPILESDLFAWIRPESQVELDESISTLKRLHIVQVVPEPAAPRAYKLSSSFASSLREALTGQGNHRSFGVPCTTRDPNRMTVEDLDGHARRRWEAILYYMVGSTGKGLGQADIISTGTKSLLEVGQFVTIRNERATITKEGFTFLLQEANAQVWSLLIVYLENALALHMEPVEMLSFLFMLGSLELGMDYSTASLTPTQMTMLDDLNNFGLVYRHADDQSRFYPTRLATTLTSDAGALLATSVKSTPSGPVTTAQAAGAGAGKGYIIVETNHRIYAYTSSLLQIAVLDLFARLKMRFPDMVAGKLTKESVQRAINLGITADQIISYLQTHAHPQMYKHAPPVLPPTVVDQIRLWQIQGDRMEANSGFLLANFSNFPEYEDVCRYAESLGVLVWKKDEKRCFFVTRIDQVKDYIAKRRLAAQKDVKSGQRVAPKAPGSVAGSSRT